VITVGTESLKQYSLDFKIDSQACAIEIYGKLRDKLPLYIPVTSHVAKLSATEISESHMVSYIYLYVYSLIYTYATAQGRKSYISTRRFLQLWGGLSK